MERLIQSHRKVLHILCQYDLNSSQCLVTTLDTALARTVSGKLLLGLLQIYRELITLIFPSCLALRHTIGFHFGRPWRFITLPLVYFEPGTAAAATLEEEDEKHQPIRRYHSGEYNDVRFAFNTVEAICGDVKLPQSTEVGEVMSPHKGATTQRNLSCHNCWYVKDKIRFRNFFFRIMIPIYTNPASTHQPKPQPLM